MCLFLNVCFGRYWVLTGGSAAAVSWLPSVLCLQGGSWCRSGKQGCSPKRAKKKNNLTVQHLTDQREDEERGKCGESVTHKGDEMLQEPARKGKGGAVPQWAGESDRAKGRNAEYVEGEKASRIYLPVCSDSDCAVWWRKVRARNNGDKQRDSGRYSGLRRTPNGQLRSFPFLFFHFDWPWCLCSHFLQQDVFLAFAEVYHWYLFTSLFLPVYFSLFPFFSLCFHLSNLWTAVFQGYHCSGKKGNHTNLLIFHFPSSLMTDLPLS